MTTTVVHLKRKDGVVVQGCDIYIGRKTSKGGWDLPRSKWANPFTLKEHGGQVERVLTLYTIYLKGRPHLMNSIHELKGKVLGCWCKPNPCHGDILAEMANSRGLPPPLPTEKSTDPYLYENEDNFLDRMKAKTEDPLRPEFTLAEAIRYHLILVGPIGADDDEWLEHCRKDWSATRDDRSFFQ
jgi:hypothetical protein